MQAENQTSKSGEDTDKRGEDTDKSGKDTDTEDEDIDCEALKNRMMRDLEKEKKSIRNWHKVLMRVQMVNAFKLSMRNDDQGEEDEREESQTKIEKAWWEQGQIIINPERRFGLIWGVFKTLVIFVSLFTLTYSGAFLFRDKQSMTTYEMIFDLIQALDIVLTCFTAIRSRDISEATRLQFARKEERSKRKDVNRVKVAIKFESEWEFNLKMITVEYLRHNFWMDFLACIPGLITLE